MSNPHNKRYLAALAAEELRRRKLASCFDAEDLDSRPTDQQKEVLTGIADYTVRVVFGGNRSGKSQVPARELAWILTDTHPTWKHPWISGPLLILVAAQDLTGAETELWNNKLKKFLDPNEWKEIRQGQILKKAVHKTKGHQIVFLSHANSSEEDIKHLQMYTAHYVWIDEAPRSVRVFEELLNRISTTNGRLIASMTLKRRDGGTRKLRHYLEKLCDGKVGKIFTLSRLKNPKFAGKEEEELAKLSGLPEDLRMAILEGHPVGDDLLVFEVPDHAVGIPQGYHPSWRHVLSVDPATESRCGVTVWAECPKDGIWWCVKAKYIEGVRVPSLLVEKVESEVAGLNVYKRIYDTASAWYANQARHQGYNYLPVAKKADKNAEMIAKLQEALGKEIKIAEWCNLLLDEFEICQRSEVNDSKIANAHKYHLIDSAKYFVDSKPRSEIRQTYSSHDEFLIEYDDRRRKEEYERRLSLIHI